MVVSEVKLTGKQELFVNGLIEGKSQVQAYIDAGYSVNAKTESSIYEMASKLLKNNKIMTRYNELKSELKDKALWTREESINDLKWIKEQSRKTIEEYGEVKHAPATAYLGAITELNKLGVLYDLEVEKLKLNIEKQKKELANDQSQEDKIKQLQDAITEVINHE
ncbi:terminase [Macrococcoides caseolyticum subsp. caseolyticum]|nr:terminase [Macrococcus caseolyticus]PKF29006.1 terminase [Macrococcus caseolyticus]PNZ72068.1 terminase [Macrococcus caseolyticus]RAK47577.1 terminase [Macrococcus caseolyticus subsp. caseolyticus]HCD19412.1 terminase [Macrococcus caseolyticus]